MATRRSGYFKTSYAGDMALFDTKWRKLAVVASVIILFVVPFVFSGNIVYILDRLFIVIIGALALGLLTGYAGQISLGHAAFLGIGAIASHYLSSLGLPFIAVLPLVVILGGVLGAIVGFPALRLRGLYLVMATVGFHFIVVYFMNVYQTIGSSMLQSLTGLVLPRPDLGFTVLDTTWKWYYFLLLVVICVTAYCVNVVRTRPGRAWIAIRDRDITAAALGVNVSRYKITAFVVSSAITCFAGSLLVYFLQSVSAEYFTMTLAISYLAMIVIGGAGSILGVYLGAIFVTLLPYVIRFVFDAMGVDARIQMTYVVPSHAIMFGALMIAFLLGESRGLMGIWRRMVAYFELWPLSQSILGERK